MKAHWPAVLLALSLGTPAWAAEEEAPLPAEYAEVVLHVEGMA